MEATVRASSLTEYPDCARRWAARSMGGAVRAAGFGLRRLPANCGAAIGTATHAAVAFELEEKMRSGRLGNATESEQRGLDALATECAEGAAWDDVSPDMNTAQKQVIRQTRTYRRHIGEKIEPVAVERRLTARHESGLILSGQQDAVVAAPATLRDLKTGKARRLNAAQYGAYSMLLRSHGQPVVALVEDYVARVPVSKTQPPPVTVPYDQSACERLAARIVARISDDLDEWTRTGEPDAFLANPNSLLCSAKWCPAHGTEFCTVHKGDAR